MKSVIFVFTFLFAFYGQAKTCTYEFDLDKSVIEGTGFKYTKKKGVTGKFLKYELNKKEKKSSIKGLLDGLVVTVDLMSLDSGDALRDKNLRETLFAAIIGNAEAKVEVKKVTDKTISTNLLLNEKSLPVDFSYTIKNGKIEAQSSIDALKFAMDESIAALKKRCGSLHKDKDGISKTWTDFGLAVKAVTKKVCK